jgi:methyl-accepting chemotaxis protein
MEVHMKQFQQSSFRTKLTLYTLFLVLATNLIIATIGYQIAKEELEKSGESALQSGVHLLQEVIKQKNQEVLNGLVTTEEAQENVKRLILGPMDDTGIRPINPNAGNLGENGYFFVLDSESNLLAHPSMEGQNTWNTKDMSGKDFYVSQDIIENAINGGGYSTYSWKHPYTEVIEEKRSYQEYNEEWDWILVSSIYMSDFNAGANRIYFYTSIALIIIILLVLLTVSRTSKYMTDPLIQLRNQMREIAKGNFYLAQPPINRHREIIELNEQFNQMKISIIEEIESRKHAYRELEIHYKKNNKGSEESEFEDPKE